MSDLATLAADPTRVESIPPDRIPALLGEVEALRAALWVRLQSAAVARIAPAAPDPEKGLDRLLTVDEAAARLGVSRRWIYRKADELPFTRRLSGGTLRFSERGLGRWQTSRARRVA